MISNIGVLDHGYVSKIETWGSDERVIEAARMSTGKGFQGWGQGTCGGCLGGEKYCPQCKGTGYVAGDEKLLKFLWDNQHHTPFEMAGLVVEVKAPIFVFREWHRHRVPFSYNEMSARYIPLPDENYLPYISRLKLQGGANKQAQGANLLAPDDMLESWLDALQRLYKQAQLVYETGIRYGIPKELARLPVPVARYSRMRASSNLRGWLHFLALRMAPNAQWEIRQYANAVGTLIQASFPRTWELFKGEQDGAAGTTKGS